MSETTGAGPRISLYDHALRLHEQHPDSPLPKDGEPFPNEPPPRRQSGDQRLVGADVAVALDRHFADPAAEHHVLAEAVRGLDVPIHRNDHITAAALRADRERVRDTGRWLVRHGTDKPAVAVGLALLASDWDGDDIPLVRTIGLLSNSFGPLAADVLKRRRWDGVDALLWLGDRVAGWGRVYVVEALCRIGGDDVRRWLLRSSCDGDFLNGYFAGKVATAAHLHEAITGESDDDLVDHTGRLLAIMAECGGMGMTLESYPPAHAVLDAYVGQLDRQLPTPPRFRFAAAIAHHLNGTQEIAGVTPGHRSALLDHCRALLDRDEWCEAIRAEPVHDYLRWLGREARPGLGLRAFEDLTATD